MSTENHREPTTFVPLLKPYGGVGATFWQRQAVPLVGVATTLLALPYGFYYAVTTPWLLVAFIVPIAVLMMLVIWVLPTIDIAPERTFEVLLFGAFVTLGLWPSYLAIDFPGLPWITIIRLFATPLVLLVLITISMSPKFRTRFGDVLSETPVLWRMMVALVVVALLSIAFSKNSGDSVSKFFVRLTNETAIFFIAAYVFRRPGRTERWAALFWAFAVLTSIVGLVEFRQQRVLWAGHVPPFFAIDETVAKILAGGMRFTTEQYRTQSVFSTSLGFSEFLAFALPFVIHFGSSGHYKFWVRVAAWASIPLILMAVLATDSRLGILGFFLASMFYLFFWALRLWSRHKHSLIAPAVLFGYPVLFVLLVISSFTVGRIKAKVWGMGQYDNSNQARIDQVHMGLPKVLTHPIGHGPGQAAEALGYMNLGGTVTIDVGYLATAIEYGPIGFVLYYGLFIGAIVYTLKYVLFSKEDNHEFSFAFPLCIATANFIVIKGIFAQDENHPIVFMMAGIMAGLVYQARRAAALRAQPATRPWLDIGAASPESEANRARRPAAESVRRMRLH